MADPNNSATGGCLTPVPVMGLDREDQEIAGLDEGILDGALVLVGSADGRIAAQLLDRFLQSWIVCLTGMKPSSVRPRWQPEPPNLPAAGTDWAAFGVTDRKADTFASVEHHADAEVDGDGYDELQRHEEFDVLVSFYGPNADALATALRDNAQIAQNQEELLRASMALIETTDIIPLPSLVKNKWLYRNDITVRIRRIIVRQYRVQSMLVADLKVKVSDAADGGTIDLDVPITK